MARKQVSFAEAKKAFKDGKEVRVHSLHYGISYAKMTNLIDDVYFRCVTSDLWYNDVNMTFFVEETMTSAALKAAVEDIIKDQLRKTPYLLRDNKLYVAVGLDSDGDISATEVSKIGELTENNTYFSVGARFDLITIDEAEEHLRKSPTTIRANLEKAVKDANI